MLLVHVRLRVAELMQNEQAERTRAAAEMERRAAEEARTQKERRNAEERARIEDEPRRAQEFEAERSRIEVERAASPYLGLLFIAGIIVALALSLVLGYIFSR